MIGMKLEFGLFSMKISLSSFRKYFLLLTLCIYMHQPLQILHKAVRYNHGLKMKREAWLKVVFLQRKKTIFTQASLFIFGRQTNIMALRICGEKTILHLCSRHSLTACTQFCPLLTTYLPLCGHFFALNVDKNRHFLSTYTPLIAEILCVKNGRAIVVCVFLIK